MTFSAIKLNPIFKIRSLDQCPGSGTILQGQVPFYRARLLGGQYLGPGYMAYIQGQVNRPMSSDGYLGQCPWSVAFFIIRTLAKWHDDFEYWPSALTLDIGKETWPYNLTLDISQVTCYKVVYSDFEYSLLYKLALFLEMCFFLGESVPRSCREFLTCFFVWNVLIYGPFGSRTFSSGSCKNSGNIGLLEK